MSALPPKADIVGRNGDVRYVPQADIGELFEPYQLVSLDQAARDGLNG
jgi:hypothetical protein